MQDTEDQCKTAETTVAFCSLRIQALIAGAYLSQKVVDKSFMHIEYQHRNEDTDFQGKRQSTWRNIVTGNQALQVTAVPAFRWQYKE